MRSRFASDTLALHCMAHADAYYRREDGTPTGEASNIREALRPLVALFGTKLVCRITPRDLKAVMVRLVDDGLARTTVKLANAAASLGVQVGGC